MKVHIPGFKAIFLLLTLFISGRSIAQEAIFEISEIDPTNFFKVRASFSALTSAGKNYSGLSQKDFQVIDNLIDVTPSVRVECLDSNVSQDASIILVLDQSFSMTYLYPSGETRWSWVKQGATSFINTIDMKGQTKIGMIAFAKRSNIRCKFTQDKLELLDSLDHIQQYGGTLYEPPFLDPQGGACYMFKTFSPELNKRRIVVFLTDGEPEQKPDIDTLKKYLWGSNIQLYSITVGMPMNTDLANLSSLTGGASYAVYTKAQLDDIYKLIAVDIQKKQFCSLYWDAPFGCNELSRNRNVSITFKPQSKTEERVYYAPQSSIAKVEVSTDVLEFGDPAVFGTVDMDLKFTARFSDYIFQNAIPSPSGYYQVISWDVGGSGGAPPFTIKKDSSRTIRIRFTQGDAKLFRPSSLVCTGFPCPPSVKLVGGISQIRIIEPNGGEMYSTCESIVIKWAGIESTKPVNLFYSTDDGANWTSLAVGVTGSRYTWTPPVKGTKFLIKGVVSPISQFLWAKNEGSVDAETATSLAVTKDGLYFYVVGNFTGKVKIADTTISSYGGSKDMFLAKYDTDGNLIWVTAAGGPGHDSATAVCVDAAGNAYVTGTCFQNFQFGSVTLSNLQDGVANCIVLRYPPTGTSPSYAVLGANATYKSFQAGGLKIRFRQADAQFDVQGEYINNVSSVNYSLPRVTVPTKFTATFNADMTFGPVMKGGTDFADYSKTYDFDQNGNKYSCGNFVNNISFGPYNLASRGKTDYYINKYGGTPGSNDVSDTTFSVLSPSFAFGVKSILYPRTKLGSQADTLIDKLICNNGNLPIKITSSKIIGANATDFKVVSNIQSVKLLPGECILVEIIFQPTDAGARKAQLVVSDTCASDIYLDLVGDGVCSGVAETPVVMGKVALGSKKDSVVKCLFQNTNTTDVLVKPRLSGVNPLDFDMDTSSVFVRPDSCLSLKVTFKPTAPGRRTAVVTYILPGGCENPVADLIGDGVETALVINYVDWGNRRMKTVNDSIIVIQNTSTYPAMIDSLMIEQPSTPDFKIGYYKPTPFVINSNDTAQIRVTFTPSDEAVYSKNFLVYAQANTDPLKTSISGNGTLPRFAAKWVCDTATKPGNSSTAILEISNVSKTQELKISSMDFRAKTGEFTWIGGVPNNVVVPKNDTMKFLVKFSPAGPGTRGDLIDLKHDALPGPNVFPSKDTSVDALCDGIGLVVPTKLDFGGVLICDENTMPLRLENTSWQTDIIIVKAQITGTDAAYFKVNLPSNFTVGAGNFNVLDIKFLPTEVKSATALLTLTTSSGDIYTVNLLGIGEYFNFYSSMTQIKSKPGYLQKIPISLKLNKLKDLTTDNIKFLINYDHKMLRFERLDYKTIPNWTWNPPVQKTEDQLEIVGSGQFTTPFDGEIGTLNMTLFWSDKISSTIRIKPEMGTCVTIDSVITNVTYEPFCFMGGRLIIVSGTTYELSTPLPNPTNKEFIINAGVGLDGITTIELFNSMGQKVSTVVNGELKSGKYEYIVNTDDLPNGNYLIRMQSGPYTGVEKISIIK